MHKGDKLFSFGFGIIAGIVPTDLSVFTAADIRELTLCAIKGLISGLFSLGVAYCGHILIERRKKKNEG